MQLINHFEAATFTKWKRFRGIGFDKKYARTSKSIYDVNVYTAAKLLNYGNSVIGRIKEQGKSNAQHKMFYFRGIGVCMKLRSARMLCYRAFSDGDTIEDRRFLQSAQIVPLSLILLSGVWSINQKCRLKA